MTPLPRFAGLATLAGLASGALLASVPAPALACGGFFCQVVAIDQNAERILFEVNPDGTVTTTVEITYTGGADEFSWIVPVPDTPTDLAVAPSSALKLLDAGTAPRIIPPPQEFPPGMEMDNALAAEDGGGGVYVEDLPQVGGYAPQVISSDDPEALIDWLNDNGYVITPEMEPFVEGYVASGMKFLGIQLASGADVGDIAPLTMTYPGDAPMVPLVMTSVSAEPEMSFMVFVTGAQRYESTNYVNLLFDDADLQADPRTGATNYYPLVSWQADEAGGRAFFTEYAGTSADTSGLVSGTWLDVEDWEEAQSWVTAVLDSNPYVTRLYTRLSNWEMTQDPTFGPSEGGDVSNVHDLSGHDPVWYDLEAAPEVDCGDTYCGPGGRCATTELGDGCLCDDGYVARGIRAPRVGSAGPQDTVACQDVTFDLLASLEGGIEGGVFDVCAGDPCGEGGSCVEVGGVATCECADGYAAVNTGSGAVTCVEAGEVYGPEQLLWLDNPGTAKAACGGCAASGTDSPAGHGLALAGLAAGLAVLRRRR
ncbi:DUF2330 domain-containing protein [Myxococcota bacterium]|nr:DUF2330 domain-containing protein [Myxococcota bacterium]